MRKLFDAFMFLNELDVLEIRLHELAPLVDTFILVEATKTHSGKPKSLVFDANREQFKSFPIVQVVVDDFPETDDPWVRENFQRNAITRGLKMVDADSEDRVLIGDVDEIPSRKALREGLEILDNLPHRRVAFQLAWFYYWLNAQNLNEQGLCPRLGTVGTIGQDPQSTRKWSAEAQDVIVPGGWHFGWLGDIEHAKEKIQSFAHHEMNVPEMLDESYLKSCFEAGFQIHDRQKLTFRTVDYDYPVHVLRNLNRFARYIHPC